MGHTRWQGIKKPLSAHMNEIQLAYVRGYRLALEDVIRDIDELRAQTPQEDLNLILFRAQNKVLYTLESANLTIKILERMEGESDHEPREHGEVDQGPRDAPGQAGTSCLEDD